MRYLSITIIILFLVSCGGIQKARYYEPSTTEEKEPRLAWGDGLAVADKDVCVWVGDNSALYLPLLAGPIGLPIFPLGILMETPDRSAFFNLSIWIVPKQNKDNIFSFNPRETLITFSNGMTSKPTSIQVSLFKTYWETTKSLLPISHSTERIRYPEHWEIKPLNDFTEPINLWAWSRFIIRFEKPSKDIAPSKVEIRGLKSVDGQTWSFIFSFQETQKHRYLISGQGSDAEWIADSPGDACRTLFKKLGAIYP